jgi:hypothetical protein
LQNNGFSIQQGCSKIAGNYLLTQFKKVNQMQNNELKDKIILNIMKGMENNMLSNNDLIEIIEAAGSFLNLRTISDYAKQNNKSYNGVKNFREKIELFNVNFVIDND